VRTSSLPCLKQTTAWVRHSLFNAFYFLKVMDFYSPEHHTGMVEFNSLHHPKNRRIQEPEFHGSHESFAVVQSPQYTTIATEFDLSTEAINIVVMLCNIAPTDHRSDSWVC
jgi:hypothetical protein